MSVANQRHPIPSTELIGDSRWTKEMTDEIRIVAKHPCSVLIAGPSGTGKELIARAVHTASSRAAEPFVPVDCAATTDALFASQLFGHARGAFTGAIHDTLGAIRSGNGGTIFLDELGELGLDLQVTLLRTLQERVVTPVGSVESYPVDVRIIAATNRDLYQEVKQGRFREDLLYRLNVVTLKTTRLCDRKEDLRPLVEATLGRLEIQNGIPSRDLSPDAWRCIYSYSWPGNVRELQNSLERAALYSDSDRIEPHHLPERIWRTATATGGNKLPADVGVSPHHTPHWPTMRQMQRDHLVATLRRTGYNQSAAARMLDMTRSSLRRLAQRENVPLSDSRDGRRKPSPK